MVSQTKSTAKAWTLPRVLVTKGGSEFEGYPLPSSRLGDDDAMRLCAPAATTLKVYAEHYAARAAACRGYHIGSLRELPHNM